MNRNDHHLVLAAYGPDEARLPEPAILVWRFGLAVDAYRRAGVEVTPPRWLDAIRGENEYQAVQAFDAAALELPPAAPSVDDRGEWKRRLIAVLDRALHDHNPPVASTERDGKRAAAGDLA